MSLAKYRKKRDFGTTSEPRGRKTRKKGSAFVIQKHAARRLHYDLRLELDGVMLSWAVTRGPSLVPGEKRLAVQVEDHPIEYNRFEGTIPEGEYGAGTVMIWDRGQWLPDGDPRDGYRKGHLEFTLKGEKLKGRWHLVRMRKRAGERRASWLLIKGDDEAARSRINADILGERPRSVASGRTMEEITAGKRRKAAGRENGRTGKSATKRKASAQTARTAAKRVRAPRKTGKPTPAAAITHLTHPDRVYWEDVGLTKLGLAKYYTEVWDWIAPHVTGRVLSLVRCPEGAGKACFFQKHASAGLDRESLRLLPEDGDNVIAIDDLGGLLAPVQAGVLEIHVRGSTISHLDAADRLVFDLDPGPGVEWARVVQAAREVRQRLDSLGLESFAKTTGGKGLHVVVPIVPAPWDKAKAFARTVAETMAADDPKRFVAAAAKAKRKGRIFVDYLRNSREATAICAFSTRARPCAPVAAPLAWSELGSLQASSQYTAGNAMRRLRRLKGDPWAGMARLKQRLPSDADNG